MELLENKVAVITGGGRGIGRACALLFARHGAQVVIADLGCERDGTGRDATVPEAVTHEIMATGTQAASVCTNVATRAGAEEMVLGAVRAFGRIDILVNATGIARPQRLFDLEEASWRAVLGASLDATFFSIQAAGRVMQVGGGGRIVNMTGFEGLMGGFGLAASATALGGVYGLTRSASVELERDHIQVNAVAPLTRATDPTADDAESFTPDHVAPVVLLMASDLFGSRSGLVVGVAGSRVSVFRMVESQGRVKQARGIWSPEEVIEHWASIAKLRN